MIYMSNALTQDVENTNGKNYSQLINKPWSVPWGRERMLQVNHRDEKATIY